MVTNEQIARINALAKKKKSEGLTEAEQGEQKALRAAYIESIRSNFKTQLDNVRLVDDQGNERPLKKAVDISAIIPGLKAESEYTEDEKEHVANLSDKLATELAQEEKSVTEMGNPRKPEGEAGKEMIKRMNESHSPMTDWALDFLDLQPGDTVLDIGCGGGAALQKMASRQPEAHYVGIDYSEVSVEESTRLNEDAVQDGQMEIHHGSVSSMPYSDEAFNKVISVESYFFWPDLESDLKEVLRVMAPGSRLLLIAEMYMKEGLSEKQLENTAKYEMNNLTIPEFEALFSRVGFTSAIIHLKDGKDWIVVEGVKAK